MRPVVSVIMPTLNSEITIDMALSSIRSQSFDQKNVEVLVIDGGSCDKTIHIAKKYRCRILHNPKVQQEYAKHIGLLNAKGKYIMFLDSDEILANKNGLATRIDVFNKNPKVKILFSGGYRPPSTSTLTNQYVNLFGDPFSYYMYGVSPYCDFFLEDYKRKYKYFEEHKKYVYFKFPNNTFLPLIDLCAGTTIDKENLDHMVENLADNPILIPQIPYILMRKSKSIVILKKDEIIHNSVDSLKKFLNKLKWRIIVNIHFIDHPGTGFSNRHEYQPFSFNFKKYLFIPFVFSLIGPTCTALYFLIAKKKIAALLHPLLSLYVAIYICYFYFLKLIGIKPNLFIYGKLTYRNKMSS